MIDCHFFPPKNAIDTRPYEHEKAGIRYQEKAHVRFALPDTTYPVLMIDKLLFDDDGTILPVGYYELGLSNDKKFILFSQSKRIVAKVPVYLYEKIEKTEEEKKKEEKREKERKKRRVSTREGMIMRKFDPEPYEKRLDVWAKLIDYDDDYYIIEYRRYEDKAYGAVPKK